MTNEEPGATEEGLFNPLFVGMVELETVDKTLAGRFTLLLEIVLAIEY